MALVVWSCSGGVLCKVMGVWYVSTRRGSERLQAGTYSCERLGRQLPIIVVIHFRVTVNRRSSHVGRHDLLVSTVNCANLHARDSK